MNKKHLLFYDDLKCKSSIFNPAFSWTVGLLTGAFYALHTRSGISLLINTLINSHISIVSLSVAFFFPYLFFAIAEVFKNRFFVCLVILFKAFGLGFFIFAFIFSFHHSGWLLLILFSFSCFFSSILSLCFGIFRFSVVHRSFFKDSIFYFACSFIFITLDFSFISILGNKILDTI